MLFHPTSYIPDIGIDNYCTIRPPNFGVLACHCFSWCLGVFLSPSPNLNKRCFNVNLMRWLNWNAESFIWKKCTWKYLLQNVSHSTWCVDQVSLPTLSVEYTPSQDWVHTIIHASGISRIYIEYLRPFNIASHNSMGLSKQYYVIGEIWNYILTGHSQWAEIIIWVDKVNEQNLTYGSGHGIAAVLLPGFAINS